MPQLFNEKTDISLDGVEEIVINAVDSDLIFTESKETVLGCECNWHDELGHPEIIREDKRLIVRFHERGIYVNVFGIFIGKSRASLGYGALENAKISVPEKFSNLTVNSVSGNIRTEALSITGKCQFNSMSGDIRTVSLNADTYKTSTKSGDMTIRNVTTRNFSADAFSGDITIEKCDFRRASVKSKSGDIRVNDPCNPGEELFVETLSGDVEIEKAPAISKIVTISGDVRFESKETARIDWSIKTVSGNVSIDALRVDAGLFFSTISGELSFKNTKPRFSSKNEYVIGTGENGKISIHTVSGDARLRIIEAAAHKDYSENPATEPKQTVSSEENNEQEKDYKQYAKRFVFPDESVLKIVQMNKQGIITHEESIELLKTMGYNDDEIARFLLSDETYEPQ
jgi:DUF4097 and DUF4098 domain-containing protein YvlB